MNAILSMVVNQSVDMFYIIETAAQGYSFSINPPPRKR